jgi:hypothetical protein
MAVIHFIDGCAYMNRPIFSKKDLSGLSEIFPAGKWLDQTT